MRARRDTSLFEETESELIRETASDLANPAWRGVIRLLHVGGVPRAAAAGGVVTPSGRLQVEILDGSDSLRGLRDDWCELYRRVGTEPSTSYDWTAAVVAHHLRPGDRVRIVVFRRYGQVVGLVPLLARPFWHGQGFRHLMPLADDYQTHSDWLVAERSPAMADAFVVALQQLGQDWDRFRISRLLEGNAFVPLVVEALRRRGIRYLERPQSPSYFLSLPSTFRDYLAARSGKFRNYLKRVERKIGARVAVVTVLEDPADARAFDAGYLMLLEIERASWKQAHGTSIAASVNQTGFFRDVCRRALADRRLHLQLLTIEGEPVAYNLGLVRRRQYAYLKTSFSDAHRDVGAATFLRARLIEDLIARGVTAVDFPGPPYLWERQWTSELRWHSMLTVYSGTLRSRMLEVLERVKNRHGERTLTFVDPRMYPPPRKRHAPLVPSDGALARCDHRESPRPS
jgi:CelD/BcsL family acetyltransferase involved in cellulose biosynthesis